MRRTSRVKYIAAVLKTELDRVSRELSSEGQKQTCLGRSVTLASEVFPDRNGAENEVVVACLNRAIIERGYNNYPPDIPKDPAVIDWDHAANHDESYAHVRIRSREDDAPVGFTYRARTKPLSVSRVSGKAEQVEIYTTDLEELRKDWEKIMIDAVRYAAKAEIRQFEPFL